MAAAEWWEGYAGDEAAFAELAAQLPDLKIRRQDGQVLLGGPPLGLTRQETLREDLAEFTDRANALLPSSPTTRPGQSSGTATFREDEQGILHHRAGRARLGLGRRPGQQAI